MPRVYAVNDYIEQNIHKYTTKRRKLNINVVKTRLFTLNFTVQRVGMYLYIPKMIEVTKKYFKSCCYVCIYCIMA